MNRSKPSANKVKMMSFISSKAVVKGCLEGGAVVLGPTVIETGTLIGRDIIVGYPSKETLESFSFTQPFAIQKYDAVSKGAKIGRGCVIRSGAVIYETVTIADDVRTGHNILIREGSIIGEGSLIGSSTKLDGAVKIGRNVKIQSNAYLPHLTVIGDDVFIAPNVCFTNDPYPQSRRLVGVVVERKAIIGANATVIAGARIGENSVVGAGSVVTRDVPPNSVVIGNPARFHMAREEFERKKKAWDEE